MELIRIDIFITQVIGFLLVLWVLKRYAWKPVLAFLEARRARIAGEVAAAGKLREEAQKLKAQYEEELKGIEARARQRIQEAMAEGEKAANEIRAASHREAQAITARAKADLELEYKKARVELREDMVTLALGATERLLSEKMDQEHHRKLLERFLSELSAREKA
jgi:F-type H+-transporting ATPase subunit b